MDLDYGKRAYIKVLELEKRLENYIKNNDEQKEKSLTYDLSLPETRAVFVRRLKFMANADGIVKVSATLISPEDVPLIYEIYRNGELVKSGKTDTTETLITFDVGAFEGENELEFSISAGLPFVLDGFKLTVQGKVDYLECKRRISTIAVGESNYVLYLNGNSYTLYYYAGESLVQKYYDDAYDACILGLVGSELYVGSISLDYGLKITIINVSTGGGLTTKALVKGVSSICGYQSGNVVTVIFVKTGEVYKGVYDRGSGFSFQSTYRRGTSVFAEPEVSNAYVISDDYKPTKFIVQGE